MEKKIKLGDTAKDLVTGYTGTVVGITEFLTGCRRITLQPPLDKNGDIKGTETFDEPMILLVKPASKAIMEARGEIEKQPKSKGGPALYKVTKY
jgi:hypothetical protein